MHKLQSKTLPGNTVTPISDAHLKEMAGDFAFLRPFVAKCAEILESKPVETVFKCRIDRQRKLIVHFEGYPALITSVGRTLPGLKTPDELKSNSSYFAIATNWDTLKVLPRDLWKIIRAKRNVERCLSVLMPFLTPILLKLKEIMNRPGNRQLNENSPLVSNEKALNLEDVNIRRILALRAEWSQYAEAEWKKSLELARFELEAIPQGNDLAPYTKKNIAEIQNIVNQANQGSIPLVNRRLDSENHTIHSSARNDATSGLPHKRKIETGYQKSFVKKGVDFSTCGREAPAPHSYAGGMFFPSGSNFGDPYGASQKPAYFGGPGPHSRPNFNGNMRNPLIPPPMENGPPSLMNYHPNAPLYQHPYGGPRRPQMGPPAEVYSPPPPPPPVWSDDLCGIRKIVDEIQDYLMDSSQPALYSMVVSQPLFIRAREIIKSNQLTGDTAMIMRDLRMWWIAILRCPDTNGQGDMQPIFDTNLPDVIEVENIKFRRMKEHEGILVKPGEIYASKNSQNVFCIIKACGRKGRQIIADATDEVMIKDITDLYITV